MQSGIQDFVKRNVEKDLADNRKNYLELVHIPPAPRIIELMKSKDCTDPEAAAAAAAYTDVQQYLEAVGVAADSLIEEIHSAHAALTQEACERLAFQQPLPHLFHTHNSTFFNNPTSNNIYLYLQDPRAAHLLRGAGPFSLWGSGYTITLTPSNICPEALQYGTLQLFLSPPTFLNPPTIQSIVRTVQERFFHSEEIQYARAELHKLGLTMDPSSLFTTSKLLMADVCNGTSMDADAAIADGSIIFSCLTASGDTLFAHPGMGDSIHLFFGSANSYGAAILATMNPLRPISVTTPSNIHITSIVGACIPAMHEVHSYAPTSFPCTSHAPYSFGHNMPPGVVSGMPDAALSACSPVAAVNALLEYRPNSQLKSLHQHFLKALYSFIDSTNPQLDRVRTVQKLLAKLDQHRLPALGAACTDSQQSLHAIAAKELGFGDKSAAETAASAQEATKQQQIAILKKAMEEAEKQNVPPSTSAGTPKRRKR